MDIAVKDLGRCKKEITVVFPAELIGKELDDALKNLTQQVVLPGFRPGKTPRSIIERKYGEEICHTVAGDLAKRGLMKAIEDHKFELVSEAELKTPHLHAHRGETMTVVFELETKAEFEVSGYRGLAAERTLKPVTDAEVDDVLLNLRKRNATFDPAPDGYAVGDWVVASVKGEVEGKVVYDKAQESISGESGARILDFDVPGLDQLLAGKKPGDRLEADAEVSQLFEDAALRGKKAKIALVLAEVSRAVLPPLDDALATKAGKTTLADLTAEIRSKLEESHRAEADRGVDDALIDQIVAKNPFEMAAGPVERAVTARSERATMELRIRGKSESEAAAEVEKKREEIRSSVERDARAWLIFEKIAKKEKIFALEDDVAREYERLARENGHTPTEVRRYYEEKDLVGELRAEILEKKVRDFLRSNAKLTDRAASASAGG
jgi:trigger factor